MKKKILLFISALVLLSSCETNNDIDIVISESGLIGTWNIIEQTLDGSVSFTEDGQTSNLTYNAFAKDINMTLTFTDNPKKASAEGSYTLVVTTSFNGQTQTSEEPAEAINDPSELPTWELNGNNITFSNDFDLPQNLIIESFSGNKLILKAEINESESDNDESFTLKADVRFVLEK